ncbi:MAG: Eco57I restriction-modification methylase domain-containing protein, partial [Thermoanaerobaculia bacterium]
MITADDVRACRGPADVAALFRTLGYPVEPIELDPAEWKRGGIEVPGKISLMARLERFDLFFSAEDLGDDAIARFLLDYAAYNQCTESALIKYKQERQVIQIHVLNGRSARRASISTADPTAHGVDRLNLIALSSGDDPARLFTRALDRELVVRQFFARFRAAVRELGSALADTCPAERTEAVADEALLIMSRLLFLCFVQEKGWLNGERRFLIDRADRCCESGADFFSAVLVPLFFGCLNTPTPQRDHIAQALGRIPYLNGGLFEPSAFERRNPSMGAPSGLMRRIIEDVFEKFDFTIEETDGAGTRVDPEMLGKVFESLMAEDERAVSGSFYTPREIVDALTCRGIAEWTSGGDAALRDQLMTIMGGGEVPPSVKELAADVVRRLESVTILDPACGSGAFLLSAMSAIEKLIVAFTDESPRDLRQRIVERSLYGVDLKPEAVRLCELRLWLAIVAGTEVAPENVRPLPNLDRNILQGNSLLSPLDFLGASRADIYREWAWGIRAQKDLIERYRSAPKDERPALYRLVRANDRRLAGDLLQRAIESDERELQIATTPRRDLFGDPVREDLDYARTLQERLTLTRRSLERVENAEVDFFSFDVHFAHVMAAGGFDLVVGNPPWVRCSRIEPSARRMYRERYRLFGGGESAIGLRPSAFETEQSLCAGGSSEGRRSRGEGRVPHQPDLSVAFVERSVGLATPGGVISMLLPGKIVNAAYA